MGDARVAYPKTTKDEMFEEIKRLPFTKDFLLTPIHGTQCRAENLTLLV